MKKFNNVKSIQFNVKFKGNGCVNFDGGDQKWVLINRELYKGKLNDNNKFAKKTFYDEGFKYKVSSKCLRHSIFADTIPFENPSIVNVPTIIYNAIAMPDYILRGYTYTQREKNGFKKKSPFTITDAIECGEIRKECYFDFCANAMEKSKVEKEDSAESKNSTSIHLSENVGELIYESEGGIDLTELQFISDDMTYDRLALGGVTQNSVEEKIYLDAISRNMVNMKNPKMGYYYKNGTYHQDEWGEKGLLLNKESVDMMVKRLLTSILNVNICRANAFFKTIDLEITVNSDEGNETFKVTLGKTNESENIFNVNECTFEYKPFYLESDEEKIKANYLKFEEFKNESKSKVNKSKKTKSEE